MKTEQQKDILVQKENGSRMEKTKGRIKTAE